MKEGSAMITGRQVRLRIPTSVFLYSAGLSIYLAWQLVEDGLAPTFRRLCMPQPLAPSCILPVRDIEAQHHICWPINLSP
jgi:hypothetical protein